MNYLLLLFVMLMISIPVAAQEFQSVRPTIVVSSAKRSQAARQDPGTVWCCGHRPLRPSWVLPPAAPLVPRVTLPPLLLFHTKEGLRGYVIEGAVALPIGGQPTPSIFTPTWGLWDPR